MKARNATIGTRVVGKVSGRTGVIVSTPPSNVERVSVQWDDPVATVVRVEDVSNLRRADKVRHAASFPAVTVDRGGPVYSADGAHFAGPIFIEAGRHTFSLSAGDLADPADQSAVVPADELISIAGVLRDLSESLTRIAGKRD